MSMTLDRTSGEPLYLQICQKIKQLITDGEWENGKTLPPEPILCDTFGVARGTIRQALTELDREGFISRERGRGTFVIWNGISTLEPRQPNGQIGFVVPYVRDSYVSTILLGVERVASDHGLSLAFKHVGNDPEKQVIVLEELVAQGASGIVVYPVDSNPSPMLEHLIRSGYPIVLVDRYLRNVSSDYVISDHFGGALRVTQHLINLGHERIGFVSWADPAVSLEHRYIGYQQALIEAGLAVDAACVFEVIGYPAIDKGKLKNFLQTCDGITAVFAANDQIALAIYETARQSGIRIPEDLALVGFDNLEFTSYLDVPLTTIAQPAYEIGVAAVETLLRRMRGEVTDWQQVIQPTQLITRQSCGVDLVRDAK